MAGIGAAFSGLAQGLGQGLKLRSDLEDAEARRVLMKTQKEAADLQLEDMRTESAYKKDVKTAVSTAFQDDTPITAAPAAPATAADDYSGAPTPGIAVPGSAPANPGLSDFEKTARAMDAVKRIDLKYGKVKPLDALKQAREFSTLQNEGVTDAFKYFAATGDQAGTLERFNATGSFKAPEGTVIETRKREMIPGQPDTARPDYVAKLPNGREISFMDVTRNSLNPKDLMSLETETGLGVAKLALMKQAEDHAAQRHTEIFKLTEMKYDKLIAEQKSQTAIAMERLGLAKDEARGQKVQMAFTGAFGELTNSLGVNKKFDPALASDKDKAEQAAKLLAASSAQSIFEMNYDLKKNGATLSPQQALNVWKTANANPSSVKFDEETGMHYVEVGKKPVYVPSTLAPQADKPAASAPSAPAKPVAANSVAPAQPRPGIQTPPTVEETQARFRSAQQFVTQAKSAASQDAEISSLKAQQQQAIKAGRAAEANNLLAKANQLLQERYNLTPLGGIADPSKLNQQ